MGRKISDMLPQKVTSVARWLGTYPGETDCVITSVRVVPGFKPNTTQLVIKVDKGGCLLNVNQENQDTLMAAFGDDDTAWVGKSIHVSPKTITFKGTLMTVLEMAPAEKK